MYLWISSSIFCCILDSCSLSPISFSFSLSASTLIFSSSSFRDLHIKQINTVHLHPNCSSIVMIFWNIKDKFSLIPRGEGREGDADCTSPAILVSFLSHSLYLLWPACLQGSFVFGYMLLALVSNQANTC